MNKWIKFLFITIVNLCLVLIFLIMFDYYSVRREYNAYIKSINSSSYKGKEHISGRPFDYNFKMLIYKDVNQLIDYNSPRRLINPNFPKRPIIVYGCSYAYGDFLNTKQTFGYKLSTLTSRPVYNFAGSGWGLQHMYFQLENNNNIYKQITNPQYAVYIFMGDHIHRMFYHYLGLASGGLQLGYVENNNKLIRKTPFFIQINRINILKNAEEKYLLEHYTYNTKRQDKNFNLMKTYFIESRKKLVENYPNIKFIIVKYPYSGCNQWYYYTPRWKELEKQGFIVVDLEKILKEDLLTDEYRLPDGHPNEKAWNLIVPELVHKLAL